jgi:hypothetical protein
LLKRATFIAQQTFPGLLEISPSSFHAQLFLMVSVAWEGTGFIILLLALASLFSLRPVFKLELWIYSSSIRGLSPSGSPESLLHQKLLSTFALHSPRVFDPCFSDFPALAGLSVFLPSEFAFYIVAPCFFLSLLKFLTRMLCS